MTNTQKWLLKLWAAFVKGGSHAGRAYIGLALGHTITKDIPMLSLSALCIIVVTSGAGELFKTLEENPVPEGLTITTETVITKTPAVDKPTTTDK